MDLLLKIDRESQPKSKFSAQLRDDPWPTIQSWSRKSAQTQFSA